MNRPLSKGIDPRSNNPFPGLRPYRADERRLYFGRDEPAGELIGQLGRSRFLAVVGVSGSGKSSLVSCGMLPALHGGFLADAGSRWRVAMFRPGNDPIGELARALVDAGLVGSDGSGGGPLPPDRLIETVLRRGALGAVDAVRQARLEPGEQVLIVVDQFEELFRFEQMVDRDRTENDRPAFVKLLLEAARSDLPLYVALTMRSDFLGECAQFRDLPEAINDGLYLIPRLTRDQLRETITGPIAVADGSIAPRLVTHVLNAAGEDPARLPILQHALMRTWDAWHASGADGVIDLSHYEAAGGVENALDDHLGSVLEELGDDRREVVKRLFRHLVEITDEGKKIRREATVDQLCAVTGAGIEEVRAVIEAFRREGRTFLMPPVGRSLDAGTPVDLSHESLIHAWSDLRGWIEDDADSVRLYRDLSRAAELWKTEGRSPYQDPELQRALNWRSAWEDEDAARAWAYPHDRRAGRPDGYDRASEFLSWSERERSRRRLRVVGAIVAGFAAVLAWALVSTASAKFEARAQLAEFAGARPDPLEGGLILAELGREESFLWRLVSRAWLPLSRKRDRIEARGVEVALGLLDQAIPGVAPLTRSAPVLTVAFDSTGERVIARFEDDTVELLDAETGESLDLPAPIEAAQGRIADLFFVDESTFALYDEDNRLRTPSGETLAIPAGRDYSTFSPDGRRFLALYTSRGLVCVWSTASAGTDGDAAEGDDGGSAGTGDAPNGAECGEGPGATSGSPAGGSRRAAPLALRHENAVTARFSLDGAWLVTISDDGRARVWNLDGAGDEDSPFAALGSEGRHGAVRRAAVSRASGRPLLATVHGDTAQVWEIRRELLVPCFELPHQDTVTSVTFDRAGERLLTASEDGTARLWYVRAAACSAADSLRRPAQVDVLSGHGGRVDRAQFGLDGSRVLTRSSADSTVRLWNVETIGRPRTLEVMPGPVPRTVALSEDRSLVATGGDRGGVRIYRSAGTRWFTEPDSAGEVWYVAVDAGGARFATGTGSSIRFWDRAGRPLGSPDTLGFEATHLEFLADGRLVASGDTTTQVWTPGGARDRELTHRAAIQTLAVDASGSHILAGLGNGWVERWDVARGTLTDSIYTGQELPVEAVARSRQGYTATGDRSGRVRVWTPGGDPTALDDDFAAVSSLAFSPDGRSLAAVTGQTLRVRSLRDRADRWSAGNAEPWREWEVPGVLGVHFLSDSTLVTAASGGAVTVWHAVRRDPLRGFHAGPPEVGELSVSADGSVFATWHDDSSVRLWPQTWRGLLRNLRERATRACLDTNQRVTRFGEASGIARDRADECRTLHQTHGTDDR